MNAPATAAAIAEPTLVQVAIDKLRPSPTHIQALRRQRFDKKALEDLAESIRKVGILQPIVATPFRKSPLLNPTDSDRTHTIVAGERRWLAAKLAGLKTVPVSVRDLTDEQVLEVQLIENLQREGLHELEEAEGYEELMKLKKINADALGDMVGKSRSYVYARLKLLALCPEARKAFYAGELDASRALLIARIGHHDTQRQAMKAITKTTTYNPDPLSYREAALLIQSDYMLRLAEAPFKVDDATLLPQAGTCAACPKRTGNQRELFPDVKSADVCTDPKCFAEKRAAHWERVKKEAEAKGKPVISGKDAKEIFNSSYNRNTVGGGYTGLDQTVWDDPKHRKVKDIVAADDLVLVQHPDTGELHQVAPTSAITEALNAKGIKTQAQKAAAARATDRAKREAPDADDKIADEVRRRTIQAIFKAAPARLGKPEILDLLERLTNDYEFGAWDALAEMLGLGAKDPDTIVGSQVMKAARAASEAVLARVLVACHAANDIDTFNDGYLKACAARYKVDPKKIESQVKDEARKKAAEAVAKASPKAFKKALDKVAPKKAAKGKGKKK